LQFFEVDLQQGNFKILEPFKKKFILLFSEKFILPIMSEIAKFGKKNTRNCSKVEAPIWLEISDCSYSETRFALTKNTRKSKVEKEHKTYFSKFFWYEMEYFL
jgi:hypothetical protein